MDDAARARGSTAAAGVSLVEVLIALGVLGVALTALAAVVPMSAESLHEGARLSIATFLAEQRLDQIAGAAWSATPPIDCVGTSGNRPSSWAFDGGQAPHVDGTCGGADAHYPDETAGGDATRHPPTRLPAPFGAYTRAARVQPCELPDARCGGIAGPGLRLVTVRVGYVARHAGGAEPRWVELSTLIAQR
jgi:type II secretory pathway pseudopilin PulG